MSVQQLMPIFIATIAGYLLGSLNGAQLIHHALRPYFPEHITRIGTKIAGTTNVWLFIGKFPAIFVLTIDIAKGFIAVWLAQRVGVAPPLTLLGGIAAIAGHNWPLFFHFRGGRGVATLAGAILAFDLPSAIFVGLVSLIFIFIRWSGLHPFALMVGMTIAQYQRWGLKFVVIMIICSLILLAKRLQAYWLPLTRKEQRTVPLKTLWFSIFWYDSAGTKPLPLRQLYNLKLLKEVKEED